MKIQWDKYQNFLIFFSLHWNSRENLEIKESRIFQHTFLLKSIEKKDTWDQSESLHKILWQYDCIKNKYLQCSSQNSLSDSSINSTVDKMEPNNSLINIFIYKLPLLKLLYIFYLSLLFYLIFITHFTLVTFSFGEFFNILSWISGSNSQ